MMCQANTHDRIRAVMGKVMNCQPADFTPESSLTDLGMDSLDTVEISMELEDEFGIDLGEAPFSWLTVQDIFNSVKGLHG